MAGPDAPVIMLSAGEASGDLHGATLCRALREVAPDVRLVGMGGARMAEAGMEIMADPTGHAVVGMSEAVGQIPRLYRAYRALVRRIYEERPRALVLIDFPEFNLRLARQARRAGVPVVYFIPPQLWAWRRGRIRQMARRITRVLAVFPFEQALYETAHVGVEFVGHPLLDVLPLSLTRDDARRRLGLDPAASVLGLLPGSRREEVARLLPAMLDAARRLAALLAVAAETGGPQVEVVEGLTHEVMAASDVVLIASGTATLEAALLGVPMVVCYRVSRLTETVARMLARVSWISLPNIVAGRRAVPEVLQDEVTGHRLASEALHLLEDAGAATAQRASFKEIRGRLGEPGVGQRAARAVLKAARVA